jgi:hypothetical protein
MKIGVPGRLIRAVAAVFSAYLIVLAVSSLDRPTDIVPVVFALILYAAATTLSLLPFGSARMPIWMAAFNAGVVVVITLAVSVNLHPNPVGGNGYATWYVGAAGALLTITATRHRFGFAWAGCAFLVMQTIAWSGPGALVSLGVIGSVAWVAMSQLISSGMAKASKDAHRFALAEREATQWQALQEAHVHERQFRLGQTNSMALGMLRQIESSGGNLTASQRQECLYLEGAIRDEIRGRRLLSDGVRREVMLARRRGTTVTLLDEGGIDDLSGAQLARVHSRLAMAIADSTADKVIARTVPDNPQVAVTVVGLHSVNDASVSELGDGADDEVDLWLEIPRHADDEG